jgi:hypothetical protein
VDLGFMVTVIEVPSPLTQYTIASIALHLICTF